MQCHATHNAQGTRGLLPYGPSPFFQGPPSLMDAETDEGMDYTGCSPGAASSESSTMDRSCSSTPVGNESTAAGEFPRPSRVVLGTQVDSQAASKEAKTECSRQACTALGVALRPLRPFCPPPCCLASLQVTSVSLERDQGLSH